MEIEPNKTSPSQGTMEIEKKCPFPPQNLPMETETKGTCLSKANQDPSFLDTAQQVNSLKPLENQMDNLQINSGRFYGPGQKPKTANQAFGNISDWILFFENRNPEMKEFAKEFEEIEKKDPKESIDNLNKVLVPKVFGCVNLMFQKFQGKASQKHENEYEAFFADAFQTWKEFFEKMLKAYTKNSFLYIYMNEFLRNEDWEQLDDLLPYTYSLFKAFLWEQTEPTLLESFKSLKEKSKDNKLILYRGAAFDEDSLKYYNTEKVKNFSWNGVISTSLDIRVAEKFKLLSHSSKTPVLLLIIIEIDFEDLDPQDLNALDLKDISENPNELEVALPPGSIFGLLALEWGEKEAEMRLKLVTNTKSLAHQGQFLHGMLQTIMRNGDELKLVCLQEKELSRAIKYCKGNKLIKDLEFCFCTFNQRVIEVFEEVVPRIWNLHSLTLNIVLFEEDCRLDRILECIGKTRIKKLQILATLNQQRHIEAIIENMQNLTSLENLKLNFEEDCQMNASLLRRLFQAGRNSLNPKCVLDIDIGKNYNITTKGWILNEFEVLQVLSRNWPAGWGYFPREEVQSENQVDQGKEKIEILESWKGFARYRLGDIQGATLLDVLKSKFRWSKGSQQLELLTNLDLRFSRSEIVLEELNLLCTDGIKHFRSLKVLSLNFRDQHISNEELKVLSGQGLKYLSQLTSLELDLSYCGGIGNEGLKSLASEGIQFLPLLTSLELNLSSCRGISDEGLKILGSEGIRHLSELIVLRLNFESDFQISNEGLESLFPEGIISLPKLTSLYLNFRDCRFIPPNEFLSLYSQEIQYLSFQANFIDYSRHPPWGWASKLRQHLPRLTFLDLGFQVYELQLRSLFQRGSMIQSLFSNILEMPASLFTFWDLIPISENFQNPFLPKLSPFDCNPASVDYCADPGFYFKGSPLQSETSIPKLLVNYPPCNLKGNYCLSKQPPKKYHVLFKHDFDFGPADDISSQEDVIASWKEAEVLSLILKNGRFLTPEGLDKFYSRTIKCFKDIKKLHLRSDASFFSDKVLQNLLSDGIKNLSSPESINFIFPAAKINETIKKDILRDCVNSSSLSITFLTKRKIDLEQNDLQLSKQKQNAQFKGERRRRKVKNRKVYIIFQNDLELKNSLTFGETFQMDPTHQTDLSQQKVNPQQPNFKIELESCLKKRKMSEDCSEEIYEFQNSHEKRKFSLLISREYDLSNKQIYISRSSFQGFSGFKSLLELGLNFHGRNDLTNRELKYLSIHMGDLDSLKVLNLHCYGCRSFSDDGLSSLSHRGLKQLERLIELNLNFGLCGNITDKGVGCLSSKGIKHLKLLKKLSLNFEGCQQMTDKGFHSFSEVIGTLNQLTDLNLTFSNCPGIRDLGSKRLLRGMKILKLLKTLVLDFNRGQIRDLDIYDLSKGIKHLDSLIDLHLSFDKCAMTDQGLEWLSSGIQNLKSLTSLYLSFNGYEYPILTDKALESLCCRGIEHLDNLKTLEFISHDENIITDQGIKSLALKGMPRLILLENFKLPNMHIATSSPSVYEAFKNILTYFGLKQVENLKTF